MFSFLEWCLISEISLISALIKRPIRSIKIVQICESFQICLVNIRAIFLHPYCTPRKRILICSILFYHQSYIRNRLSFMLFHDLFQGTYIPSSPFLNGKQITLINKKTHLPRQLTPYVSNERIFNGLQFASNKKRFEQRSNKICSLLNNASFGTFFISIGLFFESHWVFECSANSAVLSFLKQNRC